MLQNPIPDRPLVFFWDNFGPMHNDRCEAVALAQNRPVIGLEMNALSATYDWLPETGAHYDKRTLFSGPSKINRLRRAVALLRAAWKIGRADWFLCHYERPEVFALACALRLTGQNVTVMGCSKFDDIARRAWREAAKALWLLPYGGAIGSGVRSVDYFRFLGVRADRIFSGYNSVSITRMRRLAKTAPAPDGTAYGDRHFSIVARFVTKKNLLVALRAYAIYHANTPTPRPLHLCGSGPLEPVLRAEVTRLHLTERVVFRGFLQSEAIAELLGQSLALILPSVEEQFGNVVIEAQALGVPVILSDACGARDTLVRSGVNGFVFEADNPEGLAFFMGLMAGDEPRWRKMARAATPAAEGGDVARFVDAVGALTAPRSTQAQAAHG